MISFTKWILSTITVLSNIKVVMGMKHQVEASSAELEPDKLNSITIKAIIESGIAISLVTQSEKFLIFSTRAAHFYLLLRFVMQPMIHAV
jgi:hypothetical protein